jgi:hypothetical protein
MLLTVLLTVALAELEALLQRELLYEFILRVVLCFCRSLGS